MAELTISYEGKGMVHNIKTGSSGLGDLTIDHTNVPEDQRGGVAKQLLASSALYCFCTAFAKALETRGAVFSRIEGKATLETGRDDKKRARITKIALDVTVFMDEEHEFVFERVEKIMKQGCLVTGSLEPAFPVTYALHHQAE